MESLINDEPGRSHVPTGQEGLHPDLEALVLRHLNHEDRTPIPEHTLAGYVQLKALLQAEPRPLVLDSGCGNGSGTAALARSHPDAWVLGVDRSSQRLRKGPAREGLRQGLVKQDNLLLLRADLPSVWRLLAQDNHRLQAHFFMYPNPYPKRRQVMRRWHAHPAFRCLWALGGQIELRTNWPVYAEEMAQALRIASAHTERSYEVQLDEWAPTTPQTKFEAKYVASGHRLYRVLATPT